MSLWAEYNHIIVLDDTFRDVLAYQISTLDVNI